MYSTCTVLIVIGLRCQIPNPLFPPTPSSPASVSTFCTRLPPMLCTLPNSSVLFTHFHNIPAMFIITRMFLSLYFHPLWFVRLSPPRRDLVFFSGRSSAGLLKIRKKPTAHIPSLLYRQTMPGIIDIRFFRDITTETGTSTKYEIPRTCR